MGIFDKYNDFDPDDDLERVEQRRAALEPETDELPDLEDQDAVGKWFLAWFKRIRLAYRIDEMNELAGKD